MNKTKHIALSISKKAVELVEINNKNEITATGRAVLSKNALENFLPNSEILIKGLVKAQKLSKPKEIELEDVQVILPGENFLLTTIVAGQDKDAETILKKELPGDLASWFVCHQELINPETDKKSFVISAVKKDVISLWQNFLTTSGLSKFNFIADYLALTACVDENGLKAVLHLGEYNSKLLVVFDGKIIWGESLPFGEKTWRQTIDEFADLSDDEVVDKYEDLFKKRPKQGSLSDKAEKAFEPLIDLLNASFLDFERFFSGKIVDLTVFGDLAGVKGFNDVLSKQLDLPIYVGNCPAKKVKSQNYASAWGGAKLTLISNIYNLFMPKFITDEEEIIEEKVPVNKLKNRSIDAAVYNANSSKNKKNPIISTLVVSLLLIVIVASAIWFYSNWQTNQPIEVKNDLINNVPSQAETNEKVVTADIRFSIEADKVNVNGQRVARTAKVQLTDKATSTDESFVLAASDLAEDESLWPIMFGTDTWLIYRQPLLVMSAQDYLKNLNASSTASFEVSSLVPKKITNNKLTGEYVITATVEIKSSNSDQLYIPNVNDIVTDLNSVTSTDNVVSQNLAEGELLIANTPAGWANVRSGPGLQNEIVGKVNDGEKYSIIEQDGEWYKIKLTSGETAWVIKKYTSAK